MVMIDATPLISGTRARIWPAAAVEGPDQGVGAVPLGLGREREDEQARDQAADRRDQQDQPPGPRDSVIGVGRPLARRRQVEVQQVAEDVADHRVEQRAGTPTAPSPAMNPTSGLHTATRPAPGRRPAGRQPVQEPPYGVGESVPGGTGIGHCRLVVRHSWVDNMRWVPAPAGRPRGKRTKGRGQREENGDNPTARSLLACSPAFFPLAFVFRLFPSGLCPLSFSLCFDLSSQPCLCAIRE